MTDTTDKNEKKFSEAVDVREIRKLRARKKKGHFLWFGLGTFGIVGWSVAIPMVVCIFIGIWLDSRYPGQYAWTLMLLAIGLILGCLNAWTWISRERKNIKKERENHEH
nr:AtpZ/AtpI family protein [uncultured Desulfobacter sp.]